MIGKDYISFFVEAIKGLLEQSSKPLYEGIAYLIYMLHIYIEV